jgi:sec-independent protein translocase protein TatA
LISVPVVHLGDGSEWGDDGFYIVYRKEKGSEFMNPLFAWIPGPFELIMLFLIGVVLFGRRLPDVGRSLGKTITEFKKGMKGLGDDLDRGKGLDDDFERGDFPPNRPSPPSGPAPKPCPVGPKYPNWPLFGAVDPMDSSSGGTGDC